MNEDYRIFSDYKIYEDGTIINRYGKELSKRARNGRYEIRLLVDGKRRNFILTRLMYWLFIEPFDLDNENLCVIAKDGNLLNVYPSNLSLVERKDLIQGEGHKKRAVLTNEQIEEILKAYEGNEFGSNQYSENKVSYADLAKKYGVSKSNIAMIIKKRSRNPEDYKLK
ncbi:hypothetical protein CVD28_02690 [Bacillus sp. M6-12]|uniref:hypothetical protein n=1 Tax=Bacillus sp. M6-12 TaxID=2054166 RepID=UPI000C75F4A3|nr:hypothetical protein [Bacillus sp. M6-12]PLS19340.1 hypothetical protein CVD28_02690 [Bacillus sp. M6-12]